MVVYESCNIAVGDVSETRADVCAEPVGSCCQESRGDRGQSYNMYCSTGHGGHEVLGASADLLSMSIANFPEW